MVSYVEDEGPQIPRFYAGRSLFITGATGFMGKVLVERLLTTCPDVDRLFLLVRPKKNLSAEDRLLQLKESQVFDNIRQECPSRLEKLSIVSGDITLPGLGLTADAVAEMKNVSVVFHSAATLKFHEPLPRAVQQNVRSVLSLLDLCDTLPNMQALVHVSTAYSNSDLSVVEERVYPPPASLDSLLALTDAVPEDLLHAITDRYISPKPNTYTFTKAMAEAAVQRHGCRGYPVAIFRPSIVISALRHPFPGWVENLNGPTGVVVGAGKGLLHVLRCRGAARADMLPVDIAIDSLIALAWETATDPSPTVRVYNCSTYNNPTTWKSFEGSLRVHLRAHPLEHALWWPFGSCVQNRYLQKFLEVLLQTIPLHLAEYGARIFGIKTKLSLIMVSNRLQMMNKVLNFFAQREWYFVTDNMEKLRQRLTPQDAAIYNLDTKSFTWDELVENFIKGTKKYVLKEKEENLGAAKRHLRTMFYVHNGVVIFIIALVLRLSLQNQIIKDFAYGAVKLLFNLCTAVTSRFLVSNGK